MNMHMKAKWKMSLFFICCGLAVLFVSPFYPVLALEKEDSGHLIAYVPLSKAQSFQIHYIHSIHKTPVLESFRVSGNEMVLEQLEYHEFNVGMPSSVEGDAVMEVADGRITLRHMHRPFSHIDLRVAQVTPDHQLIINGTPLLFEQVASPGSWIRLRIRKLSLLELLKGDDFFEQRGEEAARGDDRGAGPGSFGEI